MKPAYCWYLNDEAKFKNTYGALYNWHCVNTGKLCPNGWHVPSYGEWESLVIFLGGDSIAGAKLKESGTEHWYESEISSNLEATNSSGFTALPGGFLSAGSERWSIINFESIGLECVMWSSTAHTITEYGDRASVVGLSYGVGKGCSLGAMLKSSGISVRCIKD